MVSVDKSTTVPLSTLLPTPLLVFGVACSAISVYDGVHEDFWKRAVAPEFALLCLELVADAFDPIPLPD